VCSNFFQVIFSGGMHHMSSSIAGATTTGQVAER
jgi:hypothetical protein